MKNEKQQQAKNLYFQTNLNKSQIAEMLGINRRTVMLWVQQGNWDRLKMSAQHLPSMVVEKCYYMLDHYLSNLLSGNAVISTFGPKEAAAINQMATGIKKLRNRSAANESMEMLNFFLEDVRRKDPAMAEAIMPFAEQYIATRSKTYITDFLPAGFNDEGLMSYPEEELMEHWLDEEEQQKMERENTEVPEPVNVGSSDRRDDDSHIQSTFHAQPDEPYTPSSGSALGLPTLNDHKTSSQSRKLSAALEKQLTTYLKNQNKKAA